MPGRAGWQVGARLMSYLVLARKYRPRTFTDLVGQEQVSRTLKNALTTGRVAHAYLFSGPRGVGKTTAARLLAMALSCQEAEVGARPCGQCENCLEIQSGQAVDVIEVDGASNRGINEIRDLRETVKYLPAKSRYKVYIIDEVHALTKDAFNALLKTLEEPPPHVVFIFATTETHKVLPTILSRCQRYDFRRIRVEDISARLAYVAEMEKIEAEPEALELIARQAEGGLRDSLSLMDQAIAASEGLLTAEAVRRSLGLIDQALVRRVVLSTLEGEAAPALGALDEAYLRGYDFKDLGVKVLEYIRGLTLIRVDRKNAELLNLTETEENDFAAQAEKYSLETLNRQFDAWLKFQRDLGYSQQPRWLLEAQVIRLAHLAPVTPMAELVEKLGKLLAVNPPPQRPATTIAAPSAVPIAVARPAAAYQQPAAAPATPEAKAPPAPKTMAEMAEMAESPAPAAATETAAAVPGDVPEDQRAANWEQFVGLYGGELDEYSKSLLKGAGAVAYTPQAVSLLLSPTVGLGTITRRHLEKTLPPLLERALGQKPNLTLEQAADPTLDHDFIADRLEEFKKTPEAKALMEELPGGFVTFRPGATIPDDLEASESPEEEESAEAETAETQETDD
ncbi:DNA polymerase III subunit gamma/tau [Deltaproteobacteria bacterium Smac51]|nr:DNA polymerase III subunit gamma/tau [Deltaproteobacteria bacterium Smac51]